MEGTTLRLLIVDDDDVVRDVLKLKLESRPEISLSEASSPEEALEKVAAQDFDLVLLDLRLLFGTEGFVEVDRNVNTEDEEIDVVYRNESKHPTWQKEGSLILVECKNWISKRVGKERVYRF